MTGTRGSRGSALTQLAAIVLSGGCLTLAFPEADVAPLAWVALVPLLMSLGSVSTPRATAHSFAFGVAFFGTLLVWVSHVGWLAWTALVLMQAAYLAAFGLVASLSLRGPLRWSSVFVLPSLWVALDYVRSVVPVAGFTWGQLAQSQTDLLPLLRVTSIGGAWLLTWIVVAVNASIALAVTRRSPRPVAVSVALLVVPFALPAPGADGRPLDVAVVQGNVPEDPSLSGFDKLVTIAERHADETADVSSVVDLVVWPESALGLDVDAVPEMRAALARAAGAVRAPMIVGGEVDVGPRHRRVVAFEVSDTGAITDTYVKTHLVPFGEYVPARPLFDWIPALEQVPSDALAGDEATIFEVAGDPVAPVISFEGDFGSLVRGRIAAGGRLLVVATNTSTWGRSWASAQHLAFSRLRAAENGVWVVHAAISGISAFVAPDGTVVAETPLWTRTHIERTVRFADTVTPYTRTGDLVPLAAGTIALVALVGRRRT